MLCRRCEFTTGYTVPIMRFAVCPALEGPRKIFLFWEVPLLEVVCR